MHVCTRDSDRRERVLALKGVPVEENRAVVLGDHVEILRQRTISDNTCSFLHANDVPRAVEVTSQRQEL